MEELVAILIMLALLWGLVRLISVPIRLVWKLVANGGVGLLCLLLVNMASGVTGLLLPINPLTVLIAGFLGLPGIGILAVVELWL